MKLTTPLSKVRKSKSKTTAEDEDLDAEEQEEDDQATVLPTPPDISERGEIDEEEDDRKARCVKGVCTLVKWLGFISGMLTLVLWAIHIYDKKVSASLPEGEADFFDDVNLPTWRNSLFSFNPDVFVDAWTPFIMGVMAMLMHFEKFHMPIFTAGWFRFCVWNLTLALFADLGYAGIAGLLVGSFSLFTSFLSFCLFFFHTGPAHLFDLSGRYISTSRVRESPLRLATSSRRLHDEGEEGERGTFRSGLLSLKSSFWKKEKSLSQEQKEKDGGSAREEEDDSSENNEKNKKGRRKKKTISSSSSLSEDKKDEANGEKKEEGEEDKNNKEKEELNEIKEEEEEEHRDVDVDSSGQGAAEGGAGE